MKLLTFILFLPSIILAQSFDEFYAASADKDIHRAQSAYATFISQTYTNYHLTTNKTYTVLNTATPSEGDVAVLANPTVSVETNIVYSSKPAWILAAEQLYIKNLTDIGYAGAWTNMNNTFEEIGLDLLIKIDQTNDIALAETSLRKKSVLESLYLSLNTYASTYGITDLRKYPFGETNITSGFTFSDYVLFNGEKYFKSN